MLDSVAKYPVVLWHSYRFSVLFLTGITRSLSLSYLTFHYIPIYPKWYSPLYHGSILHPFVKDFPHFTSKPGRRVTKEGRIHRTVKCGA